jgi:hypothetical protein
MKLPNWRPLSLAYRKCASDLLFGSSSLDESSLATSPQSLAVVQVAAKHYNAANRVEIFGIGKHVQDKNRTAHTKRLSQVLGDGIALVLLNILSSFCFSVTSAGERPCRPSHETKSFILTSCFMGWLLDKNCDGCESLTNFSHPVVLLQGSESGSDRFVEGLAVTSTERSVS